MNRKSNKKWTPTKYYNKCQDKHGKNFIYVTEFTGTEKPITIKCIKHDIEFTLLCSKQHLKSNSGGCPSCSTNTHKTTDDFILESREIYGENMFVYDKTKYISINDKITFDCTVCGSEITQFVKSHYKGAGCTVCSGRAKHTTESFIKLSNRIHDNRYLYGNTIYGKNNKEYVIITCKKHGDFQQKPNIHLSGSGCRNCAYEQTESKAVKEIKTLLLENEIDFIQEMVFDGCRNILPLRFDFYIPSKNICIEYDGLQHFESCGWGGIEKLKQTQTNDKIKNDYCKKCKIKLLRIKYNENHILKIKNKLKI